MVVWQPILVTRGGMWCWVVTQGCVVSVATGVVQTLPVFHKVSKIFPILLNTIELQWPEHLWDNGNMF